MAAAFNLTAREIEILVAYVKESKSDVDWNKVAAAANCKTSKYARDKFALIRNKLIAATPVANGGGEGGDNNGITGDGETATPKSKSKAKATPRKRKADDVEDEETPVKRNQSKKAPKAKLPKKAEDDEEVKIKDEPNEAGELMDDLME